MKLALAFLLEIRRPFADEALEEHSLETIVNVSQLKERRRCARSEHNSVCVCVTVCV